MTMLMRKEEAVKLMQIRMGHMHVPKMELQCRRGRENVLLHVAKEIEVDIRSISYDHESFRQYAQMRANTVFAPRVLNLLIC